MSPFQELNLYDKEVILENLNVFTQIDCAIPKVFESINYNNYNELVNIEKVISQCKALPLVEALKLLSGSYLCDSIRRYAVQSIDNAPISDIQEHLIQIVQALKYEMYHDSYLARSILKKAIHNPLSLGKHNIIILFLLKGHSLFWNLRSEMFNPNIRQRFGLYLEIFLTKIGPVLRKIFEDESWLIKKLVKVADLPHMENFKKNKNKDQLMIKYKEKLMTINKSFNNREISMPLNFKMRVKGLVAEKCKIMKSKKKPMWLVFENSVYTHIK